MRCQNCGRLPRDGYEEMAMLCWPCMEVRELIDRRVEKLQGSVPMLFYSRPVDVLSPRHRDWFSLRMNARLI